MDKIKFEITQTHLDSIKPIIEEILSNKYGKEIELLNYTIKKQIGVS